MNIKKKSGKKALTPEEVLKKIEKKKKVFENYNIKRMNDLIKHLSAHKLRLFNTIPFLLHVNSPDFPGYIRDNSCIYGIFGFHDSGFWKIVLKQKNIEEKFLQPYLSKKYHIVGLYLMGSSGTLAQSKKSDFDFWVIIDKSTCKRDQISLLSKKLTQIKIWADEKFNHEVNFFIIDSNDIRHNKYMAVDEESSGTAQRTILKEEFYRTFILIAGKVPYWAVLPVGADDETYNQLTTLSLENEKKDEIKDTYIDLGNLTGIRKSECPGAILWQIYKSNIDPAKAMIKAALITYYNFFPKRHHLPCNVIKKKYSESLLSSTFNDPYAIIFDRVISFFNDYSPEIYSDTIQECIFLRLNSYLSKSEKDSKSPKQKLLKTYAGSWKWSNEKIEKFRAYREWTEDEKTAYDEKIVNKISMLYDNVLKSFGDTKSKIDMKPSDFKSLRNRIAKSFKTKENKLPRCSSYLNATSNQLILRISCDTDGKNLIWKVYNAPSSFKNKTTLLYEGPQLVNTVGWIIANELFNGNPTTIAFHQTQNDITAKHAKRLFFKAYHLMKGLNYLNIDFMKPPKPYRLLTILDTHSFYDPDSLNRCEFILQNTWGEIFYTHQSLSHVESLEEKCYEIANYIDGFLKKTDANEFIYDIIHLKIHDDNDTIKRINEKISNLNNNIDPDTVVSEIDEMLSSLNKDKNQPFLLDR